MKKYVVAFCLCAVFFLPVNSYSQTGECIQGDCKNGKGTFVWPDGKKYDGDWKEGERVGQGTSTWPDGAQYTGAYKNTKKHGEGTFIWPNGAKYSGNFEADG